MKLRTISIFFIGLVLTSCWDLVLYLARDAAAPEIGRVTLSLAAIAQFTSLIWLGLLSMPRFKIDQTSRSIAVIVLLSGCYWALWAFHYSGCHRIKLLGHGQCALPRTAQISTYPYRHSPGAAPNNSFKPTPHRDVGHVPALR